MAGDPGPAGAPGPPGPGWAESFESLAQNLAALPHSIARDAAGRVLAVTYALPGGGGITRTLVRDADGRLSAVTLSGDLPPGIAATKHLLRDASGTLTALTYA